MVWPSSVPAGMPSDNASGVPTIATAIARPCRRGTTMRLAYPATSDHNSPALIPAMKRATSITA
ncbi:hypothetical protein D3C81_2110930 [compost metagenome]